MVWPSLVVVEAVCATVFLMLMLAVSIFISAPLTERANVNQTPNPSKAPWYFLNLQELLLHMDAGVAGVIVPTVALVAIAAIPYFDRTPLGVGILGTSAKGRKIAGFSAVWTTVVLVGMIFLDELTGRTGWGSAPSCGRSVEVAYNRSCRSVMLISIADAGGPGDLPAHPPRDDHRLVHGILRRLLGAAVIGTSFRGPGQHLMWPWDLPLTHH